MNDLLKILPEAGALSACQRLCLLYSPGTDTLVVEFAYPNGYRHQCALSIEEVETADMEWLRALAKKVRHAYEQNLDDSYA